MVFIPNGPFDGLGDPDDRTEQDGIGGLPPFDQTGASRTNPSSDEGGEAEDEEE